MQKASGFHRKSDASQFHILFSCWSNPSFTLPALPVLPISVQFALCQLLDKQHNGIGGALFSVSDSGGNAVVFEKGSANGSWVRAADQSVKVDNVTYFTSIPTNAGGLSHWRATRLIIRGGQIHDADS